MYSVISDGEDGRSRTPSPSDHNREPFNSGIIENVARFVTLNDLIQSKRGRWLLYIYRIGNTTQISHLHSTCNYIWSKDDEKCFWNVVYYIFYAEWQMGQKIHIWPFYRGSYKTLGKRENLLPKRVNLQGWQIRYLLRFDRVLSSQNSCLPLICTGSEILNLLLFHTSTTKYAH